MPDITHVHRVNERRNSRVLVRLARPRLWATNHLSVCLRLNFTNTKQPTKITADSLLTFICAIKESCTQLNYKRPIEQTKRRDEITRKLTCNNTRHSIQWDSDSRINLLTDATTNNDTEAKITRNNRVLQKCPR